MTHRELDPQGTCEECVRIWALSDRAARLADIAADRRTDLWDEAYEYALQQGGGPYAVGFIHRLNLL